MNSAANMVPLFAAALGTTAMLALAAAVGSMIWGSALFFIGTAFGRIGRLTCDAYVQVFRNIPVLLPIYLVYFGFPLIGMSWSAETCGVFALVLQQGAYVSEILRGSAQAVDRNQYDAAMSIGLTRFTQFRKVILPQIVVYSLPALNNQAVLLLKDTALLSAITVVDLMMQARLLVESSGVVYLPFVIATALYLLLVLIIDLGFALGSRVARWQ